MSEERTDGRTDRRTDGRTDGHRHTQMQRLRHIHTYIYENMNAVIDVKL